MNERSASSADGAGRLVLVVGPSGAGKDTLMAGARAALAGEPVVFARREITRPADPGGEGHRPVSEAEFAAREAEGAYLLSWRAHGLSYGLPADLAVELGSGRTVVANVSRGVLKDARRRFPTLRIVYVDAPPAKLAERLLARGREARADVQARLSRGAPSLPGPDVIEIRNDGMIEEGVAALVAAITR